MPYGCVRNNVAGVFEPVLAKHSKHFSLQNALPIGVDKMQRNFEGMRMQVEDWQSIQLADVSTLVAARQLRRRFLGIELDSGYSSIASKRLQPEAM